MKIISILLLSTFYLLPTKSQSFEFAFLSDTHIGSSTAAEDLSRTIMDINKMKDRIAFAIVSGDITELGSDAELKEAKELFDQLEVPWYVVPGNHDTKWSESGCNSFRQIFGYERVDFEVGGMKFVGCSSGPNMRMAPGLVPREDLVWLDSIVTELEKTRQPLIFINHYPLDDGLANWYEVVDILKRANTQAMLCGHGHRNKNYDFEGIPGAMGRSNLRAKYRIGGYNLVSVQNDSLFFRERTPGYQTGDVWRKFPLEEQPYQADATPYPRPSYEINEQYPHVKKVWAIQDDSDIAAEIIVVDDLAIYPNANGCVRALNVDSGKEIWAFQTGGRIFSSPVEKDGKIVIASTDSVIYCIEKTAGELIWKKRTEKAIVAHPVIDEDRIYIGSSEGKFRCLDLNTGKDIWTFDEVDFFIETKPAYDEERVYFGSWGTYFYALDKKTGELAWKWNNGRSSRLYSPAACHPVVTNGRVFIVAPDRYVTALDGKTGGEIWRSNEQKGRESICLSEDGSVIYIKSMNDKVFALSTASDELKTEWVVDCQFGYDISPTPCMEKNGMLYVPTDKGVIYAVDTEKKEVSWGQKLSNALINNIYPLENGDVLTTTMDGGVFRLRR
jgi:outer membrane protein assembly factor BamB/Icc-related predicted phosphoesterase